MMAIEKLLPGDLPLKKRLRISVGLAMLLVVMHGFLSSGHLDHPPFYDELYHLLAAESWRTSGELRILDGEYDRAPLFTKMVALNGYVCGPSLECARRTSVVAAGILIFSVTVISGTAMHPAVGVLSGVLLATNTDLVRLAQYVRFYPLHALVFTLFAFSIFALVVYGRRLGWAQVAAITLFAAAMFFFSKHLHELTRVGLLGVIVAAALLLAPSVLRWLVSQKGWVILGLLVIVSALLIWFFQALDIEGHIERLRSGPAWAQVRAAEHLYYFKHLSSSYPVLWPAAGVLVVLGMIRWPKLTIYCLAIFSVILLILSLGAAKNFRYLFFALPFLVIPMAAGIWVALNVVFNLTQWMVSQLIGQSVGALWVRLFALGLVFAAITPLVAVDPAVRGVVRTLVYPDQAGPFRRASWFPDWSPVVEDLRNLARDYPVVVSCSGVKAAYYLGDFSFDLSYSVMMETDTGADFGLDRRTGRQVVSSADAVARIVRDCGPTLVIVEEQHLFEAMVPQATVDFLDQAGDRTMVTDRLWVWKLKAEYQDSEGAHAENESPAIKNCRPVGATDMRGFQSRAGLDQ